MGLVKVCKHKARSQTSQVQVSAAWNKSWTSLSVSVQEKHDCVSNYLHGRHLLCSSRRPLAYMPHPTLSCTPFLCYFTPGPSQHTKCHKIWNRPFFKSRSLTILAAVKVDGQIKDPSSKEEINPTAHNDFLSAALHRISGCWKCLKDPSSAVSMLFTQCCT